MLLLFLSNWLEDFFFRNPQYLRLFSAHPITLFIYRLLKRATHWYSGQSELYRLCRDRRFCRQIDNQFVPNGRLVTLISLNLKLSKALEKEYKLVTEAPPTVQIDLPQIIKIIALKKGIQLESEPFSILSSAISSIKKLNDLKEEIKEHAETKFDKENSSHLALLKDFWRQMMKDESVPEIPDEQWKELGFQGRDPETDFRGMGLLGLENLVNFVKEQPKEAHNAFQLSKLGTAWYSYAIVGINFTLLTHNLLLKTPLTDEYFYTNNSERPAFDRLYGTLFSRFNEYWIREGARDVMDFSRIYGKLKDDVTAELDRTGGLQ